MIKVIILSQPADAPTIAAAAGIDEGTCYPDGNLNPTGLRKIHAQLACTTAAHGAGYTAVVICTSVSALVEVVHRLCAKLGPIDLLDIVGHGAAGLQKIGDEVLFEADTMQLTTGSALVAQLRVCLAPHARLRLLGCKTACGGSGRVLLGALGLQFGVERTVYGTIERVTPSDFDTGEFSQVQELLFSSEAAVDHEAPDATTRTQSLQTLAGAMRSAA